MTNPRLMMLHVVIGRSVGVSEFWFPSVQSPQKELKAEPQAATIDCCTMEVCLISLLAIPLVKGIAAGVGKQVGAALFKEIFGESAPDPESYVKHGKLGKLLSKIVSQELDEETIDSLDGRVKGIRNWMTNTYVRNENNTSVQLLRDTEREIVQHVIGPLMTERKASMGLELFAVAAAMHLAILHELNEVVRDAGEDFVGSMRRYATDYVRHLQDTRQSIQADRRLAITSVVTRGKWKVTHYWRDTVTDEVREYPVNMQLKFLKRKANSASMKKRARKERKLYMEQELKELKTSLTPVKNFQKALQDIADSGPGCFIDAFSAGLHHQTTAESVQEEPKEREG